jgi:hypothetical protein
VPFLAVISVLALACSDFVSQSELVRLAQNTESADADSGKSVPVVPIGKAASIKELSVMVKSVLAADGDEIESAVRVPQPGNGKLYLLVEIFIVNQGAESAYISSRQEFNLFDSSNKTQPWALLPVEVGSIDGRIDPGRERQGRLVWEVSEDATGLKMVFGGTVFTIGEAASHRPGSTTPQ